MDPTNKVNFVVLLRFEKLLKNENLFREKDKFYAKYIDTWSCIVCVLMWLMITVSKLVTLLNTEIELRMGAVWVEVELNKSIWILMYKMQCKFVKRI